MPIDESHDSERAIPIAIRFAERMGASVEILGVADAAGRAGSTSTWSISRIRRPVPSRVVLSSKAMTSRSRSLGE